MGEYCRYLKSDIYKLRRSWFFGLHLLFPALGAAAALLYARLAAGSALDKLAAFAQLLAIAFPFAVSVVCQAAAGQEAQAGHFQNMRTLPSRAKALFAKLTVLALPGLPAAVCSAVLFGLPFSWGTGAALPAGFFVGVPAALWASNGMLYGLHLLLALRFGRNVNLSVGAMGSLLAALLQTGLGTGLWYVLPYGLGTHFAQGVLAALFHLTPAGGREMQIGILFCLAATCGILGLAAAWFSRYEGAACD